MNVTFCGWGVGVAGGVCETRGLIFAAACRQRS